MFSLLSTLAYSSNYDYKYDYGYSASTSDVGAAVGVTIILFVFFAIFALAASYVVTSLLYMGIFKKAGLKPSIAWIPFYNVWKFFELGGQKGVLMLTGLIPIFGSIVFLVFSIMAAYNIGLKLGKSAAFVLLYVFLGPIWFLVLIFDSSKWDDSLGEASLAEGTIIGYVTESEINTTKE